MLQYYRKLCNVVLEHTYYTDGYTPDFSCAPTRACAEILRGHGILFKEGAHGFTLVYRARDEAGNIEPATPISDLPDDTILHFNLRLKNEQFMNFTEFGFASPGELSNKVLRLNTDGGIQDAPQGAPSYVPGLEINTEEFLTRKRSVFTHVVSLTGNPPVGELRITDWDGNLLQTLFADRDVNNNYSFPVDLSGEGPGKFTFTKYASGAADGTSDFYVDDELAMNPVFARLEIVKDTLLEQVQAHNADDPENRASIDFRYKFDHKEGIWSYRVVFKVMEYTGAPANYSIKDAYAKILNDRYNQPSGIQFYFNGAPAYESFLGYPSVVLRSSDIAGTDLAYPFYEEVKHDLELSETTFGSIIKKLPNPNPASGSFEIIVYV